ncbi:TDP-N-acetylfucosamine:lipid II N-acetylfucosaminyltransferase [Piscinibacter sp.]|uniref:TDP-N-acetylfucosamine:lipid II N-acetylfucosaminyltransferase n=1 Tax=Piscinibacter sp. TaxID=1903157 RepID=UPI0039E4E4B9
MRIVHLARDEKFVPLLRQLFDEALPGANHWLIARRGRGRQRFVAPAPGVTFRPEWWFRTPLVALDVARADVIVAHSMTTIFANAIARAPARTRVAWLGWGYDYYPLLEAQLGDPILPATRVLLGGSGPAEPPHATPVRRRKPQALERVAGRLNSFSVMPSEEALLRRALPSLAGVQHEIPLFTTEDAFERGPAAMEGPDILLGNSATASNNHADAFELLRGRLGDGRLVVPLSYGNADYGAKVAALGRQRFDGAFEPLLEWMSLADYNERIRRCGFVVMNHRRQQAVGNIGAALYKGATVYLRRENPLFPFYTGLGVALRAIDELAAGGAALRPLSAAERERNRRVIGAHYARSRVLQAMRELPALRG